MAEPDIDTFRQRFAFANNQVGDTILTSCLDDAIDDVKLKIGIEAYGQIFLGDTSTLEDSEFLDENVTTTDEIALRKNRVTSACYYFAAANLVLITGIRIKKDGQVSRETANESPGMGRNAQVDIQYLKPSEVTEKYNQLRSRGEAYIAPYVIAQEPTGAFAAGRLVRA